MMALLQRVTDARVVVDDEVIAAIGHGLAVLVGVERGDAHAQAERMVERLLGYRVFSDRQGKLNHSVTDVGGGLLLVPQFTLPADTRKGTRPSLTPAAAPEVGRRLFDYLVERSRARYDNVSTGRFAAHMRLTLTNDGPVTFLLRVPPASIEEAAP